MPPPPDSPSPASPSPDSLTRLTAPDRFTARPTQWQPWLCGAALPADLALAQDRIEHDTFEGAGGFNGGGLDRGERALVALAAARRIGSIHCAAIHAAAARRRLRNGPTVVDLLLEEGLPSPLTGRPGALVATAAALSGTPPQLYDPVHRSEAERLDAQDVVDLILTAAVASREAGLRLALGQVRLAPPDQSRPT